MIKLIMFFALETTKKVLLFSFDLYSFSAVQYVEFPIGAERLVFLYFGTFFNSSSSGKFTKTPMPFF